MVGAFGFLSLGSRSTSLSCSMRAVAHPVDGLFPLRVAGSDSAHLWAVGSVFDGGTGIPAIQRWDGDGWVKGQAKGGIDSIGALHDVAAIGPDDVWAVGVLGSHRPLAEHWDGSAWREVPTAGVGTVQTQLLGVTATAANDAWAVGRTAVDQDAQTLAEHWDGSSWRRIPSPNVGSRSSVLRDVDATAPNDVWAVGWWIGSTGFGRTLAERWDGSTWSVVPTPRAGGGDRFLTAVAATAPDDVWAVGWQGRSDTSRGLLLHWDGSRWHEIDVSSSATVTQLTDVAVSTTGVVIVGQSAGADRVFHPLVLSAQGESVTEIAQETLVDDGFLDGVLVLDGGIWTVGRQPSAEGGYGSLFQRAC